MIENVENLFCPAMFDLGERAKVVILSVTEGEDKPLKAARPPSLRDFYSQMKSGSACSEFWGSAFYSECSMRLKPITSRRLPALPHAGPTFVISSNTA